MDGWTFFFLVLSKRNKQKEKGACGSRPAKAKHSGCVPRGQGHPPLSHFGVPVHGAHEGGRGREGACLCARACEREGAEATPVTFLTLQMENN